MSGLEYEPLKAPKVPQLPPEMQPDYLFHNLEELTQAVLRVLKMKALLGMFAQGRGIKESAVRKKVMWATVMKRFIQQAAHRSLAPAA